MLFPQTPKNGMITRSVAPSRLQQAAGSQSMKGTGAKWDKLKQEQMGQVGEAFGQAKEAAGQQLGAASLEADRRTQMDLARNANASGGFGGAEQAMRTEATRKNVEQTGMAKAGMEAQLSAQEAQAKQEISQNIAQMKMDDEHFAQQFGLAKEQFAAAKEQWGMEFKENQKTNMLMALLNMKKTGMGPEAYAQYYNTYSGFYPGAPAPTFNPGGNFSQDVYNG